MTNRKIMRCVYMISLLFALTVIGAQAQENAPTLTLVQDAITGFDCTVGAALQPDGNAMWAMLVDCHREHYALHSFSTLTGERIGDPIPAFDDPNTDYFRLFSSNTLIAQPDGNLRLILDGNINDLPVSYTINPQTGESIMNLEDDAQLGAFVREFTPYMEGLSFSADHRYLAAVDDDNTDVLDMESRSLLFTLPYATTSVGFDTSGRLYVVTSGDAATTGFVLNVYSLPDGTLIQSYLLPYGGIPYPNADGRFVALETGGDETLLGVLDTTTGIFSNMISQMMPPFTAGDCIVRDPVTDSALDLSAGRLWMRDLVWLPDGETFVTLSEYVGDGMTQGRENGCETTATRLRIYRVGE